MAEKQVVLAVGAHPDDVEFNMAGTLSLLVKAGFEPHIAVLSICDLDSNRVPPDEISRIRMEEGARSAGKLGATFHPGIVNDCMILYEDHLIRKVAALIREVKPDIVLLPSLNDYMEDHMITGRLVVTACFIRGMRNFATDPDREPVFKDCYLYHAQPHLNRDGMRNLVVPSLFVDITSEMRVKEEMLMCYESQKEWLEETQGLEDIAAAMRDSCREVARMAGAEGIEYAEGWRQHSHIGFSAEDKDLLSMTLGDKVRKMKRN